MSSRSRYARRDRKQISYTATSADAGINQKTVGLAGTLTKILDPRVKAKKKRKRDVRRIINWSGCESKSREIEQEKSTISKANNQILLAMMLLQETRKV
jgi:hypothetical protein